MNVAKKNYRIRQNTVSSIKRTDFWVEMQAYNLKVKPHFNWNFDSPEKSSVKQRTGLSCSFFKLKRQRQQSHFLSVDRDIPIWGLDRPNPEWWIRLFTSLESTQTSVCFVTWKYKVASLPQAQVCKNRRNSWKKRCHFSSSERVYVCVCMHVWLRERE